MRGEVKVKGDSWRITIMGSLSEEKYAYDKLLLCMRSLDIPYDAPMLPVNTADKEPPGKRRPPEPKKKPKFNIYAVWNQWYTILRGRYPDLLVPNELRPDEAGMIKILLEDYGEDGTREIFKVAVLDWDAFRTAHQKRDLPIAPDLKTVVGFRRELAVAVSQKGITTTTQRVSKYGQTIGGAYDDWDKK